MKGRCVFLQNYSSEMKKFLKEKRSTRRKGIFLLSYILIAVILCFIVFGKMFNFKGLESNILKTEKKYTTTQGDTLVITFKTQTFPDVDTEAIVKSNNSDEPILTFYFEGVVDQMQLIPVIDKSLGLICYRPYVNGKYHDFIVRTGSNSFIGITWDEIANKTNDENNDYSEEKQKIIKDLRQKYNL